MNTVQVRNRIIKRLNAIEDEAFLKALDLLTGEKSKELIYKLSDNQIERVELARNQLLSGDTITNEELQADIEKWLESR